MLASEALPLDDLAASDLVYPLLVRLARTCPACRSALTALSREESLDHLVSHVVLSSSRTRATSSDPDRLRHRSPQVLHSPPSPHSSGLLRRSLARALLETSRVSVTDDPGRAAHAALLALRLLPFPDSPSDARLHLAAQLHRADALRASGEVEQAGWLLDLRVEEILALDSRPWRGELHLLAGRIRQAQERPDDALLHLRLARADFRAIGERDRLGRAYLRTASVLRSAAELPRAIEMASEALRVSAGSSDASLRLAAHHNLAAYLVDAGLGEQAREVLAAVLHLYPTATDAPALVRYLWLSARLAASAGDGERAAATYRKVRDRLLARGETHEAALLTAELARLHLQASDPVRSEEALRALGPILRQTPGTRESTELRQLLSCLEDDTALPPALVRELTELLGVRDS